MAIGPILLSSVNSKKMSFKGVELNTTKASVYNNKRNTANVAVENTKNNKNSRKKIFLLSAIILTSATALLCFFKNRKPPKITDVTHSNEVPKISLPANPLDTSKLDLEYKNALVSGLKEAYGIDKQVSEVQSIMGKEGLQALMKRLAPDEVSYHEDCYVFLNRNIMKYSDDKSKSGTLYKDPDKLSNFINYLNDEKEAEKYFEPLINKRCRIFLGAFPSYKINDPKEAAIDFLDKAVAYANKVALKIQDDKPPFTIGITDYWDTSVQQEVVKELANAPEKYKNLRVVINFQKNMFVDPFNKELNQAIQKRDADQMEFIKNELKENLLVLPEGYKDENYLSSNSFKRHNLKIDGTRAFTDEDWDMLINAPDNKFSRDRIVRQKQIIEDKIYNKYIFPHFTDDAFQVLQAKAKKIDTEYVYERFIRPYNSFPTPLKLSQANISQIILKQPQVCKIASHEFLAYTLYSPKPLFDSAIKFTVNGKTNIFWGGYQSLCEEQTAKFYDIYRANSRSTKQANEEKKPIGTLFTQSLDSIKQDVIKKGYAKNDNNVYECALPSIAYKEVLQTMFSEDGKEFKSIAPIFQCDHTEYLFGDDVKLTKKIWDKIIDNA